MPRQHSSKSAELSLTIRNASFVQLCCHLRLCLIFVFFGTSLSFREAGMNWTGGSLQRHSRANPDTLVKKQKQHFAKARLQSRSHYFRPPSSVPPVLNGLTPLKKPRSSQPIRPSLGPAHVLDKQYKISSDVQRTAEREHSPPPRRHQAADGEVDR